MKNEKVNLEKLQDDMILPVMNINGLTNKVDVINSVIDNIQDSNFVNAVDTLNQLKEIEVNEVAKNVLKTYGTKEESDIDTILQLENEMSIGK
tara:strand:+ start:191 stop:469 length:279 start_codon:yes stop_codon:yes gene_type:complete